MWWRAMRCSTGHGVVGASGSQAQHVRGMLLESWGTRGRLGLVNAEKNTSPKQPYALKQTYGEL